jgi:hypothetical protein
MSSFDAEMVQYINDIIGSSILRILRDFFGYIGGRIAASVECDGVVELTKITHLEFPAPVVPRKFMHKNNPFTGSGFLVIDPDSIVSHGIWRISLTIFLIIEFVTTLILTLRYYLILPVKGIFVLHMGRDLSMKTKKRHFSHRW